MGGRVSERERARNLDARMRNEKRERRTNEDDDDDDCLLISGRELLTF